MEPRWKVSRVRGGRGEEGRHERNDGDDVNEGREDVDV
jgi:hypothetical protein